MSTRFVAGELGSVPQIDGGGDAPNCLAKEAPRETQPSWI